MAESTSLVSAVDQTLQAAAEATEEYLAASKSPATRRAYASGWGRFETWCIEHRLGSLPARPETIAMFLSAMAKDGAMFATIKRNVAAIRDRHLAEGLDNPCTHAGVRSTTSGIARTVGTAAKKKKAMTAKMLSEVLRKIPDDLAGARDRALLLIGFAGAFRRSELVALQVDDIERNSNGIILTIRHSKTDQTGKGTTKAILRGKKLFPIAALDAWLVAGKVTSGSIFRALRGSTVCAEGMRPRQVARIIQARAAAAGLNPVEFGGHSLRSGYCTTAAEHGASLQSVADHAGHAKVDTTRGYMETADKFRNHSGKGFI